MQIGGVTYVGGKFTQVMSHTGATVRRCRTWPRSTAAATSPAGRPLANGTVKTFATDGAGAIIAGGSFTKIGTAGRPHIAEFTGERHARRQVDLRRHGRRRRAGAGDGRLDALHGRAVRHVDGAVAPVPGRRVARPTAPSTPPGRPRRRPRGRPRGGGRKRRRGRVLPERRRATPHAALAAFDTTAGALQAGYASPTTSRSSSMTAAADGSIYTGHFNNRLQSFTPTGSQSWHDTLDGNVQAHHGLRRRADRRRPLREHLRRLDLHRRHHIAAVDPASGALDTTWAPNVNSDLGVFALADTSAGLAARRRLHDLRRHRPGASGLFGDRQLGASRSRRRRRSAPCPTRSCARRRRSRPARCRCSCGGEQATRAASAPTSCSAASAPGRSRTSRSPRRPRRRSRCRCSRPRPTPTACRRPTASPTPRAFAQGPAVALTAFQDSNAPASPTPGPGRARRRRRPTAARSTPTSKAGAFATRTFTGRQVAWVATRTATRGQRPGLPRRQARRHRQPAQRNRHPPPARVRPCVGERRDAHDQDRLRRHRRPRHDRRRRDPDRQVAALSRPCA